MKRLLTVLLMTLVALAARGSAAHAQGYTVTDLGIISGGYAAIPRGMNDSGWVVGNSNQRRISHYKGWLWIPTTPNAPTGSLRALEPLAGRTYSWTNDVNNTRLCVGYSYAPDVSATATFWQGPDFTPVDFNSLPRDPMAAGWVFSQPYAVSDPEGSGEISVVGLGRLVTDAASVNRLIAWRVAPGGTVSSVVELNGGSAYPSPDVNGHGQAAATLTPPAGSGLPYQACLWDFLSGQVTNLGGLTEGARSLAWGISPFGDVVGESDTFDPNTNQPVFRGFVWTPSSPNGTAGTMIALGTLKGDWSRASGINQNLITGAEEIVGWSESSANNWRACIWQKAALTQNGVNKPVDLNTLKTAGATGLTLLEAYRINNKGAIIGRFQNGAASRAFLLTPRP